MLRAEKAKQKNESSRSALNAPHNYPNVPIPKSIAGLPPAAQAPAPMPGGRPQANVGASLPINNLNSPPNWTLPALPNSNITVHRVRLIEYWYNEDFQLPENPTQAEAVQGLDSWMRGAL